MQALNPNRTLEHQVLLLLIILKKLSATRTGKKVLTIQRISIYEFLLLHPSKLNILLSELSKNVDYLEEFERTEIAASSISQLYKNRRLHLLLTLLEKNNLLVADYSTKEGVVYEATHSGNESLESIETDYFKRLQKRAEILLQLQSQPLSKLNFALSKVI